VTCAHCGELKRCSRLILEQPVCDRCVLRFARAAKPCPGCAKPKVLAFYDGQRRPACAGCTGNPAVYACRACGREDSRWGRRCAPCVLAERATTLLSTPDGGVHPQLQPLYDALLAGPRPQTTLYWFDRSSGPDILHAMAQGELEISHAAFLGLPTNKTNTYLRDLLAAVGVLPPFHAELERVSPWLEDLVATLPKEHGDIIARYARWHLLRRLHLQHQRGTLTHGAISAARASIVGTARLLAWLAQRGVSIGTATQADIDQYAADHYGRAQSVISFLAWAHRTRLTSDLKVAVKQQNAPQVTLSDRDRWAHVERLLHDDTIRLNVRVAGLFVLLFAQPLSRTCRMRADQITSHADGTVTATFGTFSIELPQPLDRLVLQHLATRGQASYASQPDLWLFPGGHPGRHLATENIRSPLVQRGIQPGTARNAAMYQLASEIPTPILAEMLALHPNTAARWAALAARDWSRYIAQRH